MIFFLVADKERAPICLLGQVRIGSYGINLMNDENALVKDLASKRVLVVDDVKSARMILIKNLEKLGFRDIIEADDGKPAIEILQKESVDLVISDWHMPVIDGKSLLDYVRRNVPAVPVIIVTGLANRDEVIRAIKNGAIYFVKKPFSIETLACAIENALARTCF